ncbi:basic salivary proline-rich protein 1-like [Leopardus geoffroyi]|uniref:basic salivary proline-rich protein 1-like n=1 Tax=Leopardus geoffroyi TaxID=46844 RepID=UPI001E26167D|nr:basic salivary proline-rich protein 1-like [Leopardus geoffroyi]XP_045311999.1 basic salivary proline-rich protein 1-like [Leopardus geoffroyi]
MLNRPPPASAKGITVPLSRQRPPIKATQLDSSTQEESGESNAFQRRVPCGSRSAYGCGPPQSWELEQGLPVAGVPGPSRALAAGHAERPRTSRTTSLGLAVLRGGAWPLLRPPHGGGQGPQPPRPAHLQGRGTWLSGLQAPPRPGSHRLPQAPPSRHQQHGHSEPLQRQWPDPGWHTPPEPSSWRKATSPRSAAPGTATWGPVRALAEQTDLRPSRGQKRENMAKPQFVKSRNRLTKEKSSAQIPARMQPSRRPARKDSPRGPPGAGGGRARATSTLAPRAHGDREAGSLRRWPHGHPAARGCPRPAPAPRGLPQDGRRPAGLPHLRAQAEPDHESHRCRPPARGRGALQGRHQPVQPPGERPFRHLPTCLTQHHARPLRKMPGKRPQNSRCQGACYFAHHLRVVHLALPGPHSEYNSCYLATK